MNDAAILRIEAGARSGAAIALRPDGSLEVGRRGRDFAIPEDATMSAAHFVIECDKALAITLTDCDSSNGTFVNGARVTKAELRDGDRIVAGQSVFHLLAPHAAGPGLVRKLEGDPLDILRRQTGTLYAVLDAARDPRVLEMLQESGEEHYCLYDGPEAESLVECAPYLVRLDADLPLLEDLVAEGWGKSWGVFAAADTGTRGLWDHFRQFVMVDLEGRQVYFRFYDPRVLEVFLPTCDSRQLKEFLGPARRFLFESSADAACLEISSKGAGE